MNADRLTELAALHAAGALDPAEERELKELLAQAPASLKAGVAQFNNLAGLLGATAGSTAAVRELDQGMKARVLERIRQSSQSAKPPPFYFIANHEGAWQETGVPGARMKELATDRARGYTMRLYQLAPGARFPAHHHSGSEECYVLSGDLLIEGRRLQAGDFHHAEAGSDHREVISESGCTALLVVAGADYD